MEKDQLVCFCFLMYTSGAKDLREVREVSKGREYGKCSMWLKNMEHSKDALFWESQADRPSNSLENYSPTAILTSREAFKDQNGSVSCLLQRPLIPCPFSYLIQPQFDQESSSLLAKNFRSGLLGLWVALSPLPGLNQERACGPILASKMKKEVCWMGWGQQQ